MIPPAPPRAPFDGREFHNLDGVGAGRSLLDVLRWKLFDRATPWPDHPAPDTALPDIAPAVQPGALATTFVGHSTFLLQFAGGINVLTDPVWSRRASPVSFTGPARYRPPALDLASLPAIAVVLVSHGHYDHLDLPTLRRLEAAHAPLFLTGLRQGKLLRQQGLRRVEELDWWQSHRFSPAGDAGAGASAAPLEITFTPAQHWTARGLSRNGALWGGFWIKPIHGPGLRVFFAGDSGWGRHFGTIHEQLGTPDVAFLPIGAYAPRWFMRAQHMNPDDAVQAHLALASRRSVAMHFGTFRLTDEGIDQPAQELATSLAARGVSPELFTVPRFGETIRV